MAGITVAMFLLGGIIYASVKLQNWQAPPGVTVREDASIPRRPRVRPITDDELPLAAIPWDPARLRAQNLTVRVPIATLPKIKQRFDPRNPEPVNLPTAKLPWDSSRETARSVVPTP